MMSMLTKLLFYEVYKQDYSKRSHIRRKGQTDTQVSNQTVNTKIREPNVLIFIYLFTALVMEPMAVKR